MGNIGINDFFNDIDKQKYAGLTNDVSNPSDILRRLEKYIDDNSNRICENEKGEFISIKGKVQIGKGTKIDPFTTIEGPVIIGDNVTIGSNVHIRPYTIIEDNVCIGHGSEIKHSWLMNSSKIASLAFVGDSIIGQKARIGSGTICTNRRFDQKNVIINMNDEKVDMGIDFFGCIIGDSSRVGANCTLFPGTHIGMHTFIMPGLTISNYIEKDKLVTRNNVKDKERIYLH